MGKYRIEIDGVQKWIEADSPQDAAAKANKLRGKLPAAAAPAPAAPEIPMAPAIPMTPAISRPDQETLDNWAEAENKIKGYAQEATEKGGIYYPLGGLQAMGEVGATTAKNILAKAKPLVPGFIKEPVKAALGAIGKAAGKVASAPIDVSPRVPAPIPAPYAEKPVRTTPAEMLMTGITKAEEKAPAATRALGALGGIASVIPASYGIGMAGKRIPKEVLGSLAKKAEGALAKAEDIVPVLSSEKGAVEIPDFEDAMKKAEDEITKELGVKAGQSAKQIRKEVGKAPKPSFMGKLAGMSDTEANILSLPASENTIPFTDMAQQGIKASRGLDPVTGKSVATPYDLVGKHAVEGAKEIEAQKSKVGKLKDDFLGVIDDAVVANGDFVPSAEIAGAFKKELQDVVGAYVDETGALAPAATGIRNTSLLPEARQALSLIESSNPEMTIRQLDALSANLRRFLTDSKNRRGMLHGQRDEMDVVIGRTRDRINELIEEKANRLLTPDDYKNYIGAKRDYANLSRFSDEINRIVGHEVVPGEGTASRGAAISKRLVQSNADAGAKVVFNYLRDLTGIDIPREAYYADIVMNAIGDSRGFGLLRQVTPYTFASPAGAAANIGVEAGKKLAAGNKLDRLIDYYNAAQKKQGKKAGKGVLAGLGMGKLGERGAIGAAQENPQVHTDEFKNWFGDWKNNPEQASKVVVRNQETKTLEPRIVYHGSPTKGIRIFNSEAHETINYNPTNLGYGTFFTNLGSSAKAYARHGSLKTGRKGNGVTYPVYLNIKKPYTTGDFQLQRVPSKETLMAQGYDGIIIDNYGTEKWYIPFYPSQIKSATGNIGKFDPNNPDIRGNTGAQMLAGMSLGGLGGATAGATMGDTPEERRRNMAVGAGLGMLGGGVAPMALGRGTGAMQRSLGRLGARGAVGVARENPHIHTPEFKNWFGDWEDEKAFSSRRDKNKIPVSQAIDKTGKPKRFFHSTRNDFAAFESGRISKNSNVFGDYDTKRSAIFFTDDPRASNAYVQGDETGYVKGARTIPAYLKTVSPLDLTKPVDDEIYRELEARGFYRNWLSNNLGNWEMFDDADGAELVTALKDMGFDSVKFYDINPITREQFETTAVFSPTQIKSAIGNKGSYSRLDESIIKNLPIAAGAGLGALGTIQGNQ